LQWSIASQHEKCDTTVAFFELTARREAWKTPNTQNTHMGMIWVFVVKGWVVAFV